MKTLPSALILQKNQLGSANPWLITLDVTWPDSSTSYFVNNFEDVIFDGNTYVSMPFEVDVQRESVKGEAQQLTLKVSNVGRAITSYLEQTNGAVGSQVVVRLINTAHLAENYSELEMSFDVLHSTLDNYWATFTLGAPNPLRSPFPKRRYIPNHCSWVSRFKSPLECKYEGAETTCSGTPTACHSYGNLKNFGGFPGMSGGLKIIGS